MDIALVSWYIFEGLGVVKFILDLTARKDLRNYVRISSSPLQKFLGGGGHSGGWDDYDHQIFLKVKSHYRSEQEGLIEALLRELPARSREDVEGHEQWHRKYLHLLEEKKAAIAEWREDRKVKTILLAGPECSLWWSVNLLLAPLCMCVCGL